MAEYQVVMRHLGRMCETYQYCTDGCPLQEEPNVCFLAAKSLSTEKIKATEQAIMSWAAENPEPVYPTWREWLETQYFQTRKKVEGGHESLNAWMNSTHIPADIAQKLELEPKEIKNEGN